MIETDEEIIFLDKTMFAEGIQEYGTGIIIDDEEIIVRMAKLPEHVREAEFADDVVPLNDEHNIDRIIGFVDNFQLKETKDKGVHWNGDFHFEKKHLSPNDVEQLTSFEKRDVSIGFFFTPLEAPEDADYDLIQSEIKIDHVAWTIAGRCTFPTCGLDKQAKNDNIVNLLNITAKSYNKDSKKIDKIINFDSKIRYFDHLEFKDIITMTNDCKDKDTKIASLEKDNASLKAENHNLTQKFDSMESKIKELNLDHAKLSQEKDSKLSKVEKELNDLKVAVTAERKTHESDKTDLEAYRSSEIDSLKKILLENSKFTEEEVKEYSLEDYKKTIKILSKDKKTPGFPSGSPPAQGGATDSEYEYNPIGDNDLSALSRANPLTKDGGK